MLQNIFIFEKYTKKNDIKKINFIFKFIKKYQPLRFYIFIISLLLNPLNNFFIITLNINTNLIINLEYLYI